MATIREIIRKNGRKVYNVQIRLKGQKPISRTFEKKTLANNWVQKTETEIKEGRFTQTAESRKYTLDDLITRYIENELPKRKSDQEKFKMHLNWWSEQIGCYYLSAITPAILTECKQKLEKEDLKHKRNGRTKRTPATVNRYLATLSIVFSYACNEYGLLNDNPMRRVRKNKEQATEDRYLMPDEIERLLRACKEFSFTKGENYNEQTYLFVLIALSTGARYSEIHKLTWDNVDFTNRMFYFMNTKNGENRGVYMSDDVYNALKEYKKVQNIKNKSLWLTKNGVQLIDFRTRFYKVLELAKIENCRFHDLRHTVASHIAMNGGSILDIAQVTGHKTMQMVKRYSHLTKKHTAELLQSTTNKMFEKVNNL